MWNLPNAVVLLSGASEGETPLNAFDNALLNAGIGHLNLLKVSSIVPPGARIVTYSDHDVRAVCQEGAIVPCIMSFIVSSNPGEIISACVGIGVPAESHCYGMIYEHSGIEEPKHTIDCVKNMITSAFARREVQLDKIVTEFNTYKVQQLGCVVAVALLIRL